MSGAAAATTKSSVVLTTYMRMLRLAKRLPKGESETARQTIRKAFREGKDETSEERVRELLDSATKRISYLKMVTPRDPREADLASPSKRYVVGAGGALEFAGGGEGDVGDVRAGVRAAKGKGGLDAADFKRHEASLRRFRFEDRGSSPRSPLGR